MTRRVSDTFFVCLAGYDTIEPGQTFLAFPDGWYSHEDCYTFRARLRRWRAWLRLRLPDALT